MLEAINSFVTSLNGIVWGWGMIILLLGTHIFMTLRTKGIQRRLIQGIKLSVTKDKEAEGEVSQFGALTTALAATIGTGNIIGVGTAVALGGPGAVFWCWLTGVFGIATKYSETLISVKYRVKTKDGRMQGGAMYALERGLNMKWLVKSIAYVCERLVPFMAAFYVLGCLFILVLNANFIIPAIETIVTLAFNPGAAAGGLVGGGIMQAMHFGVARGLFSNESGMGSAPIAAAAAQTRNPVRQAMVSMTGVFWDTVIVCAMTGLVLVSSIMKNPAIDMGAIRDGGVLTTLAFNQIPYIGPFILVIGIITFAFSTILGWSYYGERCVEYFAGRKVLTGYKVLYLLVAIIAPIVSLNLVWLIADTLNAMMAIPNLIAVLLLSPVIVAETKKYINNIDLKDEETVPYLEDIRNKETVAKEELAK